jgi:hypothetical protein
MAYKKKDKKERKSKPTKTTKQKQKQSQKVSVVVNVGSKRGKSKGGGGSSRPQPPQVQHFGIPVQQSLEPSLNNIKEYLKSKEGAEHNRHINIMSAMSAIGRAEGKQATRAQTELQDAVKKPAQRVAMAIAQTQTGPQIPGFYDISEPSKGDDFEDVYTPPEEGGGFVPPEQAKRGRRLGSSWTPQERASREQKKQERKEGEKKDIQHQLRQEAIQRIRTGNVNVLDVAMAVAPPPPPSKKEKARAIVSPLVGSFTKSIK